MDQEIWTVFLSEVRDFVNNLEQDLIHYEKTPAAELLQSIYRHIHNIKGNASIVNFQELQQYAHECEELLLPCREHNFLAEPPVLSVLFDFCDWIREAMQAELHESNLKILEINRKKIQDLYELDESQLYRKSDSREISSSDDNTIQWDHSSFRIDSGKMDDLLDSAGELVLSTSILESLRREIHHSQYHEVLDQLKTQIQNLRESVLRVRLVPLEATFRRFERMVRDLAVSQKKEVELIIGGGDTELDKSIIERITDPLMHLIRNALDHGIGTPAERKAQGKDPCGTIQLRAQYETGSILIEVEDDGNGIDMRKVKQKALAIGIIDEKKTYSEAGIMDLIFSPGFSTREEATEISGRGVGLDWFGKI
jgi:two-component system chemotaxis sensor kinase CheA